MSPKLARSRLLAVTALVVAVAALAVVGVTGLVRGHAGVPSEPASSASVDPTRTAPGHADPTSLAADDGVPFARAVASALFDWDTTTATGPDQILDALVEVGDPSGQDIPGLAADVRRYLPTADQWAQLRQYATRQHLEVTDARVPDSWTAILAESDNGLADGTLAVTIDGTRVRDGSWYGEVTTSRTAVAFTVFALCPPATDDGCRLLRLSGLDTPLR
ncbi:MAG TPA: hypothetical protein DHV14_00900 [Micrococcales bacterium]|uniref:hypothetical protein n=1 Tax=Miniimonas arenae TaxID=676201 RepID=UPI000EC4E335|nr:hypothetical protein [Miniimonas arenae]HCX83704.1 hypothetical protein [Micrococcales bacterium]